MISDSDGKRYPWYGSKREVKLIEGPTTHSTNISTQMNDNFYPQVGHKIKQINIRTLYLSDAT